MSDELLKLVTELRRRAEPFALATVVRCEPPTSAKPGAKALVRADGAVSGWVGGACAEPVVVREALEALRDGRPRLISLVGEGGAVVGRTEGIVSYPMTCPSGGTLEIYVEPDVTGSFVQDCEVCCNPWRVRVSRDGDDRYVDLSRADGSE